MTNPQHRDPRSGEALEAALEQARRLTEPRPIAFTPEWAIRAAHAGDLSVLMLALRG